MFWLIQISMVDVPLPIANSTHLSLSLTMLAFIQSVIYWTSTYIPLDFRSKVQSLIESPIKTFKNIFVRCLKFMCMSLEIRLYKQYVFHGNSIGKEILILIVYKKVFNIFGRVSSFP